MEQGDIQNVFAMAHPQHMFAKLAWEINCLIESMSVWDDNKGAPTPVYIAFNTAITAWHITDWIWMSSPENRAKMATKYQFVYEETKSGIRSGLANFQDSIAYYCRDLGVCREIANGAKHMRKEKIDRDVKVSTKWNEISGAVGNAGAGDLVMSFRITDGDKESDAELSFIEAFGFWERLFTEQKLSEGAVALRPKIMKKPSK